MPETNEAQVVIEAGRAARELLDSAAFVSSVNALSNYHLAAICATPPGAKGREDREYHHLLHFALGEIVSELQGRVATGDEMTEMLARAERED